MEGPDIFLPHLAELQSSHDEVEMPDLEGIEFPEAIEAAKTSVDSSDMLAFNGLDSGEPSGGLPNTKLVLTMEGPDIFLPHLANLQSSHEEVAMPDLEAIEFPEAIEAAKTSVDSSDMPAFNGLDSGEPSGGLLNTKLVLTMEGPDIFLPHLAELQSSHDEVEMPDLEIVQIYQEVSGAIEHPHSEELQILDRRQWKTSRGLSHFQVANVQSCQEALGATEPPQCEEIQSLDPETSLMESQSLDVIPSVASEMSPAPQEVTEAIEFPEAIEAAKTSVDSSDMPAFNGLDSGEPSAGLPNTKLVLTMEAPDIILPHLAKLQSSHDEVAMPDLENVQIYQEVSGAIEQPHSEELQILHRRKLRTFRMRSHFRANCDIGGFRHHAAVMPDLANVQSCQEASRDIEHPIHEELQKMSPETSLMLSQFLVIIPSDASEFNPAPQQMTEAIEFPEAIEAAKTSVDSSDMPAYNGLDSGEPSGGLLNTKLAETMEGSGISFPQLTKLQSSHEEPAFSDSNVQSCPEAPGASEPSQCEVLQKITPENSLIVSQTLDINPGDESDSNESVPLKKGDSSQDSSFWGPRLKKHWKAEK
ncbi:uncharacterized protein LOC127623286 isoform X2 [Xyrauchen texanus]|uniref:uncharacterized protein LOC127623286 isoform X2 n=1 Tax=Xyrauchen texanus TaxID=154827 RepID=UPI002242C436|nr:uncharacterized protein LOC127623286 isoform X2 [Xyrauchen texanus]